MQESKQEDEFESLRSLSTNILERYHALHEEVAHLAESSRFALANRSQFPHWASSRPTNSSSISRSRVAVEWRDSAFYRLLRAEQARVQGEINPQSVATRDINVSTTHDQHGDIHSVNASLRSIGVPRPSDLRNPEPKRRRLMKTAVVDEQSVFTDEELSDMDRQTQFTVPTVEELDKIRKEAVTAMLPAASDLIPCCICELDYNSEDVVTRELTDALVVVGVTCFDVMSFFFKS